MIKIVIEVRGGVVQAVHCTDPDLVEVHLFDFDEMHEAKQDVVAEFEAEFDEALEDTAEVLF